MKEADLVGHEVTFSLAASNLLKFDWASRSDPMCALFEKVYKTPGPRFTQDDCGLGDFLDEVNTLSRCGVPPTQVSQVAQLMGANGLVLVQHLRGITPDLMEALGVPPTLVRAAGLALHQPTAASDNRPEWCLLAQTEWQVNTHNPSFERHLCMYYDPARDKELRFAVYNVTSPRVLDRDVIGSVEVRLSDLVQAADGRPLELQLHSEKRDVAEQLARKGTTLSITTSLEPVVRGEGVTKGREHHPPTIGTTLNFDAIARPVPRGPALLADTTNTAAHELVLTMGVHSLPKVQWGGKCNPVLLLLKSSDQSGAQAFNQLVSRTDWRSNTHDTVFARGLMLPLDAQWSRLYRIALFDVRGERLGPDDLVGYVEVTLQQLAEVALPYKDERPVDHVRIGDWHLRFGLNSPEAALQTAFAHKQSSLTFFVEQRKLRPTADVLHLFS
jgi:hypothetical protein